MAAGKMYKHIPQRRGRKLNKRQKLEVKKMIAVKQEHKAFLYDSTATAVTTAGIIKPLSDIATGAGYNLRAGDQLTVTSLSFKYDIQVGAVGLIAAADQYNSVRVIVFKWYNDSGLGAPATANIITAATDPVNAMYDFDGRHLYKVIYDRTHTVFNTPNWNGTAAAPYWSSGIQAHYDCPKVITVSGKKLGKKTISYDIGTTDGVGKYYALFISDSAFTPNPTIDFNSEMIFTDS